MDKNVGKRLAMLRQEKNISQREMATQIGMTRSAISMYELGKSEPNFEVLDTLADYFDVDLGYLLGYQQERGSYPRHEEIDNTMDPIVESEVRDVSRAYRRASAEIRAAVRAVLGVQR